MVGKVYGRILINRIRNKTENVIVEVQSGFRRGRGCTGQIFIVRQRREKYLGKGNDGYFAFLDLEKTYGRVDRDAVWNVLRLYGIGGRLLRGVKSLYVVSKACVRVGNEVSEWFPVRVGLKQGCVMSLWLFNLYIDGVVREVNARVFGRGLKLVDGNDNGWGPNQLLFVDDTVVVADSERKLCQLVTEFGRVCERRELRVDVGKSNVMGRIIIIIIIIIVNGALLLTTGVTTLFRDERRTTPLITLALFLRVVILIAGVRKTRETLNRHFI